MALAKKKEWCGELIDSQSNLQVGEMLVAGTVCQLHNYWHTVPAMVDSHFLAVHHAKLSL